MAKNTLKTRKVTPLHTKKFGEYATALIALTNYARDCAPYHKGWDYIAKTPDAAILEILEREQITGKTKAVALFREYAKDIRSSISAWNKALAAEVEAWVTAADENAAGEKLSDIRALRNDPNALAAAVRRNLKALSDQAKKNDQLNPGLELGWHGTPQCLRVGHVPLFPAP